MLAVLVSGAVGACGATSSGSSIRDLLTAGQDARDSGRNDECVSDYTKVLKDSPAIVAAYVGRGDCYVNLGNPAAALHDYAQAAQLSPGDAAILMRKGSTERSVGNNTAAVDDLKAAAALAIASPDQVAEAARLLEDMGYHSEALAVSNQGLVRYPDSWRLHDVRAGAELGLGSDSAALQDFASAIKLATGTDVAFVLSGRASYYIRIQQFTLALADYNRALPYDRKDFGLLEGRANARLGLGDFKGAETDFTDAVNLAETEGSDPLRLAEVLQARGELYLQENRKTLAAADFRDALSRLPVTASTQQEKLRRLLAVATK